MMLADTLPDPNSYASIGWWLIIGAVVFGAGLFGANQVWDLVSRFRGDAPEPPNAQIQQSVKQLNARVKVLEEWRDRLIEKLERDKMEVIQAGEDRASRIHAHIEADRRAMDTRMDALPDRVIATLKNTGAI